GGLRPGRRDRHLLADERVDERGLPDVGTADDRDETRLHRDSDTGSGTATRCTTTSWTRRPWTRSTRIDTPSASNTSRSRGTRPASPSTRPATVSHSSFGSSV